MIRRPRSPARLCRRCKQDEAEPRRRFCVDCAGHWDGDEHVDARTMARRHYGSQCVFCGQNDAEQIVVIGFAGEVMALEQCHAIIDRRFPSGYRVACLDCCGR